MSLCKRWFRGAERRLSAEHSPPADGLIRDHHSVRINIYVRRVKARAENISSRTRHDSAQQLTLGALDANQLAQRSQILPLLRSHPKPAQMSQLRHPVRSASTARSQPFYQIIQHQTNHLHTVNYTVSARKCPRQHRYSVADATHTPANT